MGPGGDTIGDKREKRASNPIWIQPQACCSLFFWPCRLNCLKEKDDGEFYRTKFHHRTLFSGSVVAVFVALSVVLLLLFLCLSLLVLANEKKGGWFIFEPILVVYVCDKRFDTVRDDF